MASAEELIDQAASEVEAIRFRLWSEIEEEDPSLADVYSMRSIYLSLDHSVELLRLAVKAVPDA